MWYNINTKREKEMYFMYPRHAKQLKCGDEVIIKKTNKVVTVEKIEIGQKIVRIYCSDGFMYYHQELE
jgi:hypothetical protein